MTATEPHPRHRLDDVFTNPVRFSIVAALDRAGTLSFKEVRDAVEITDSALSKQASALEAAGFTVEVVHDKGEPVFGQVYEQTAAAGSQQAKGSTITIKVF